eukprot:1137879-Pelagomonas_calceolata.AAC.3
MNTSTMLRNHSKQASIMRGHTLPHSLSITLRQPVHATAIASAHSKCVPTCGVQGGGNSVATHDEPTTMAMPRPHTAVQQQETAPETASAISHSTFLASFTLFLLTNAPAASAQTFEPVNPFTGVYAPGQYVTFALFLMTVPGEGQDLYKTRNLQNLHASLVSCAHWMLESAVLALVYG